MIFQCLTDYCVRLCVGWGDKLAQSQMFAALDVDGDGRVSQEEFDAPWHHPPAQITFSSEDRDGNGFLSWEEFNGPNATTIRVSAEEAESIRAAVVHRQGTNPNSTQTQEEVPVSDKDAVKDTGTPRFALTIISS